MAYIFMSINHALRFSSKYFSTTQITFETLNALCALAGRCACQFLDHNARKHIVFWESDVITVLLNPRWISAGSELLALASTQIYLFSPKSGTITIMSISQHEILPSLNRNSDDQESAEEYLFAPYSCFVVRSPPKWSSTSSKPHQITLTMDNRCFESVFRACSRLF